MAGIAVGAAVIAGSVALLEFGPDSGIEAPASIIVIWRFTWTRLGTDLEPARRRPAGQGSHPRRQRRHARHSPPARPTPGSPLAR
jgi:hypothetical protein